MPLKGRLKTKLWRSLAGRTVFLIAPKYPDSGEAKSAIVEADRITAKYKAVARPRGRPARLRCANLTHLHWL
jgi:hypothetical protein